MRRTLNISSLFWALPVLVAALAGGVVARPVTEVKVTADASNGFGTIRGVVRDDGGSPIAAATVAIFKAGTQDAFSICFDHNGGKAIPIVGANG